MKVKLLSSHQSNYYKKLSQCLAHHKVRTVIWLDVSITWEAFPIPRAP